MPVLMTNSPPPPESLFRYLRGDFARVENAGDPPLLVADSFLVDNGSMLARDVHRDRFVAGVHVQGGAKHAAAQFWDSAAQAIPPVERWFPRMEFVVAADGPEFRLRVRSAPAIGDTVRVKSFAGPDPRTTPDIKGPDIAALSTVRRESGADEAILLDPAGYAVEGTTSALLWWRDGVLHRVPAGRARVASVTERVIIVVAGALGVTVRERDARPPEMAGSEVWVVNALRGIRPVTAWDEVPDLQVDRSRLASWRGRLARLAQRLDLRSP